jgi:hypothetical protein
MTPGKPPQSAKKPEGSLARSSAAEYLTFVAASGQGGVEAVYADENIWLTQKMMGVLYDVETHTINYHLKKVFVLTDQYFEEQLQRIREIRVSERKFYQKITDICATAIDYDVTAQATKRFFATVQNKLHWAIHGQTAAEVVCQRADAGQPHMGLTSWKDAPLGKIQKFDVAVAKNYLTEAGG